MFRTSLSILFSVIVAAAIAACGSGTKAVLPPGSVGAADPGAATRTAGTAAVAVAVTTNPPVLVGTVSDIASYGFDACPPTGTVYIPGYGCIPVTTTNAKIVGTKAVGSYFVAYGSVSGANVTTTEVDFSTTAPASPAPVLAGTVSDIASYGFDACPPAGTVYITGYGCIPVTTGYGKIVGTKAVGMYFVAYGYVQGANVTTTEVDFSTSAPSSAPASPAPTSSPLLQGYVSDIAAYGFDACPPAGTVYISGYGCLPVTTTSAKVTGTLAVGMYFMAYGSVSGPNVTATQVTYSVSPPVPVPTPAAPKVLAGYVSDIASYGFDSCPPAGTVYIAGYGCLPITTTNAKLVGTQAVGMYFVAYGTVSGPNITAAQVNFSVSPPASPGPTTAPTATPVPTPVPSPSATPVLSGLVSDIASYGFDACPPSGTVYVAGYGCLPVTTTGAKITGTVAVGLHFVAYGSISGPNVTATQVVLSTPTPGPSPTATPTSAPGGGGSAPVVMTNGVPWPATFEPFGSNSPWTNVISSNPTFVSNSAAIIASEFGGGNPKAVRGEEVGQYDYSDEVVFAQASDPVVNIGFGAGAYVLQNGTWGAMPSTIHIPAKTRIPGAYNGGYGDRQIEVVQPGPGYQAIDLAYCNQPSGNWGTAGNTTISCGGGANGGNFYGSDGETGWYGNGTGDTAGGNVISAGMLRAPELIAGHINHALKLILECQGPGWQYPAFPNAATDMCPSTNGGPPMGARLWYDVPDATTNASSLPAWSKAILNALHDYGGYFDDDSCPNGDGSGNCTTNASGVGFLPESEEASYDFGQTNLWSQIPGWTSVYISGAGPGDNLRWVGADPWQPAGVNFAAHMHWLAACSAQGSC